MAFLTIARLTIREAQRRRILWVALIMGALFLLLFGVGVYYIFREIQANTFSNEEFVEIPATVLTMTGLYVTNFLVVIMSVLIAVASISGEIESRLIDTFITKPLSRWEIVVGKWLGFGIMSTVYAAFLAGGVLLITYSLTGFAMRRPVVGIIYMALNAIVMMTVTIAGGTRLSTLANGVLAFMLYGVAFIGGWVETIGAAFRNETAVNIGIIASLLMPIEALWRKAALVFQPRLLSNLEFAGPFTVTSEPSDLMVGYAVLYVVALLFFAIHSFAQRDL